MALWAIELRFFLGQLDLPRMVRFFDVLYKKLGGELFRFLTIVTIHFCTTISVLQTRSSRLFVCTRSEQIAAVTRPLYYIRQFVILHLIILFVFSTSARDSQKQGSKWEQGWIQAKRSKGVRSLGRYPSFIQEDHGEVKALGRSPLPSAVLRSPGRPGLPSGFSLGSLDPPQGIYL